MAKRKGIVVREPIQVYLTQADRALLDRIASVGGLSRAEVLRRGIRRMSAELLGEEHPALKFLREMAAMPEPERSPPRDPSDIQERFEEVLMEAYLDTHEPEKG